MTDQFVLIGHPVGHSLSPVIHRAAYAVLGRSAEYGLVDAPTVDVVAGVVVRLRRGEFCGANVTVPWKRAAFELADRVDPSAAALGVANVLGRAPDGAVVAYNTDALALADELGRARTALLARGQGRGRDAALIVGNGGAARAAVVAAARAGYAPIMVTARRYVEDRVSASWPEGEALRALGAAPVAWPGRMPDAAAASIGAIVQATSAGMKGVVGGEELAAALELSRFTPSVAYDLVYVPSRTPFLEEAERHGHLALGGLGMLVGQAARAIGIWWGIEPPNAPLLSAAEEALGA